MAEPALSIDDVLGGNGLLAHKLPAYEHRAAQISMAKLVERSLRERAHALIEAGTGTGKSFAYLVPALLSGQRVVVSTATLALQEQLLTKDIPALLQTLDSDAQVVQLKGRHNYLCRDKLERLRQQFAFARSPADKELFEWADATGSGDRAELSFVPPAQLWSDVDTDSDECIMEACRYFGPQRCHFMHAREAARHADVVVVNHALFFSDLALGGGLIPPYDCAVLDEAHQIEEWATAAFSAAVSRTAVERLVRQIDRLLIVDAQLSTQLQSAIGRFVAALDEPPASRYPLAQNERALSLLETLQRSLYRAENWISDQPPSASRYANVPDAALQRRRELLLNNVAALAQTVERLRQSDEGWIRWVEKGQRPGAAWARCAPASVAPLLRERLFERAGSVVVTSATIATGRDFAYLRRQLGIESVWAEELVAESPFDYARQALLYLPPQRLDPREPAFGEQAKPVIRDILSATRGRAFVLFTSTAVMNAVAGTLTPQLPFACRTQGDAPKGQLLSWFRQEADAVLFATSSFWEGVDVAGKSLSAVIIDRIPFPPPDDPLVVARCELLAQAGEDPFRALMIPAAITRLKQGLGRLIRTSADRGLMCILDGRLQTKAYGRMILDALPPASRVHALSEVAAFLAG